MAEDIILRVMGATGDPGSSFWVGVMPEDGLAGDVVDVLYDPSVPRVIGDDAPVVP